MPVRNPKRSPRPPTTSGTTAPPMIAVTRIPEKLPWCSATEFDAIETDVERLIELWSMHGSSEGFDPKDRPLINMDENNTVMEALRKGLRLGFTAGSDTHCARPGGGAKEPRPYKGGLVAVWAEYKTRRCIFKALMARRTYALTDSRIVLEMTVNGACMGSEVEPSEKAAISISVIAPSIIEKVQIIKNTSLLAEFFIDDVKCGISHEDSSEPGDFYHCRVVLKDGSLAVCSPVWLG